MGQIKFLIGNNMRFCEGRNTPLIIINNVGPINRGLHNRSRPEEWIFIVRYICLNCSRINEFSNISHSDLSEEELQFFNNIQR